MTPAKFITPLEVSRYTALSGDIDGNKVMPFIKIAEDTHIYTFLGSQLFDKISADITAGTLSGVYLTLFNDYIKPKTVHRAMTEYIPYSGVTIGTKGAYDHNSENSNTKTKQDLDFLVQKSKQIAENYTEKFIKYMTVNYQSFPEYYLAQTGDTIPTLSTTPGGWYLPIYKGLTQNDAGDIKR